MAAKTSGLIVKALLIIIMVISLCPLLPAAHANAATILVPETFTRIQLAVNAANPGDVISVAAGGGPYVEQVYIGKSLTIIGRDAANPPVIVADPARTGLIGGSDYIVGAVGCNLRLENLNINANWATGPIPGGSNLGGVVMSGVTGTGAGVYNCRVYGFGGVSGNETYGVIVADVSTLTIDSCDLREFKANGINAANFGPGNNVTIHNCSIWGNWGPSGGLNCIWMDGGTATVDNCSIWGGITGIASGLAAANTNITISNNHIAGQHGAGIMIYKGGTITINNNVIQSMPTHIGIQNDDLVTTGTIRNNSIFDCGTAIYLQRSDSNWSVTDNLLYNCSSFGVRSYCPLPVFRQNIIYNCSTGIGIYCNALTAHCNAILGNTTAGLALNSDGGFNVTNNYWGTNSGPNVDSAGPGTSDKIITNGHGTLTWSPWEQGHLYGTPASIAADGVSTSTITLDCVRNSAGQDSGCRIGDGLPVNFTTSMGNLTGSTVITSGGRAVTTLRSGTTAGTARLTSVFTGAPALTLLTTQVIFTAPLQQEPAQQFIKLGPATSHGSSIASIPVSQSPVQLSNVQVTSARLSTSSVEAGSPITISADVANTGKMGGTALIKVYFNDELISSQGVNVAAGSRAPVIFTLTPEKSGDYVVSVNGVQAGSLKVSGASDMDVTFITALAVFVIAMLMMTVLYLRRRRSAV